MSSTETLELAGYSVIQFLGSGARSTIWQVRDRKTDLVYALKRVVKREPGDSKFLEQAVNEYDVGTVLDHPGLRRIHGLHRLTESLAHSLLNLRQEGSFLFRAGEEERWNVNPDGHQGLARGWRRARFRCTSR